jgi:hypothetical protein
LELLAKVAQPPKQVKVDYAEFMEKFKNLLTNYSLNVSEGGTAKNCS